ncbi:hypothetical protein GNF18_10290 [Ligilactobacillus pobuzihii]|uniref:hypothetical protein n=1 Tax=Ligilactobacillus pobuzihii TaxID=449659 RepID=UPI0019D2B748|nr:hypothetical protein [Ligilactobacillus pobuzihii]MBN7275529.1 hypothetical protein [Ligilactobacillus pobuzihii]
MESDTLKKISEACNKAVDEVRKQFGEETLQEGEFTFIQPYQDGQAIIVSVENNDDGERTINTKVNNAVIVGEPINEWLDIYQKDDEQDE